MPRRFPSISTNGGPGYDTEPREDFDHIVEFTFDYSDVDATVRDVKKQLSDLGFEIDKTFKAAGVPRSKRGGGAFYLSPKKAQQFGNVEGGVLSSVIQFLPDGDGLKDALQPSMTQIGEDGKIIMRKYANRVDTGLMRGSINYRTSKLKSGYRIRIGWTQLWYKYFGFQENGTRNVPAMRSVLRTYLEMLPRVRGFADKFIRSYTRSGGNRGGATYL